MLRRAHVGQDKRLFQRELSGKASVEVTVGLKREGREKASPVTVEWCGASVHAEGEQMQRLQHGKENCLFKKLNYVARVYWVRRSVM